MESPTGAVYRRYLSCLLQGERARCAEIVTNLLEAKTDVRELYIGLFQRSMYEVGELWERREISVAVEHLATAITESMLSLVYPTVFSAPHTDRAAVIACVTNEFHQIGAKMVADIFELNGWHGYFLGANMPHEDLLRMIDEKKPELVGLSLAVLTNLPNLLKVLDTVTSTHPDLRILVGGQAFQWGGLDALGDYANTEYVASISELEPVLQEA